jgi:hypothetical protein
LNKDDLSSRKSELRYQLLEAQKKLAMLEVLAVSNAKLKEIKKQQADAMKAAEDAKRFVMEHSLERKRLQKEVAEATRRARVELNEKMVHKRTPPFWRANSSKRLLRAVTYRMEEPDAKCPRKAVTYDIEEPRVRQPTLRKTVEQIPPSPSKHSGSVAATHEVPPTIIQPTLSRRTTMHAQPALSCAPTETLLEDAQPLGSL